MTIPRAWHGVSKAVCGLLAGLTLACASAAPEPPAPPVSTRAPEAAFEDREMVYPAPLEAGATIMLVAPGSDSSADEVERARQRLEELGYIVKLRDDITAKFGYLAGTDDRRAEELMQAFLDPEVDAVFPVRGGYGTMRILEGLDYEAIRINPKLFMGLSDITGLHLALNRRAGLVTLHSPRAGAIGSERGMEAFTEEYLFKAMAKDGFAGGKGYKIKVPPEAPQPIALGRGKARGRLTGGNLSLISALEGTPYAIDTRDAILLIEDTREAPYRIDRMLRQLQLAGKLQTLRGAVLGQFTRNYDREEDQMTEDPRFEVDGVLRQYFEPLGIPVLMNYPVGHHRMNATLPLGAEVEVDANRGVLRILKH